MPDTDRKLIEKASGFRRWDYRDIDELIAMAQTDEAKDILWSIRCELYDFVQETL